MAKNRMINTRFWNDTYISDLDSLEKLLFIYLITNQYTNICGIYEIPVKQIALDTGIDRENLTRVLLPRMEEAGKIYYIDGWVYVKNFLKHQKASGNVQLGIDNGLKDVPEDILAKIKEIDDTGGSQGGHSLKLKLELKPKDTVAKATPTILINKELYHMEELEYVSLEDNKRPTRYGNRVMAVLVRYYAELTGTKIKGTFDASEWSKPLGAIYRYFDKNPNKAMEYMKNAVEYYKSKNLDFKVHTLAKSIPDTERLMEELDKEKYNPELYE